MAGGRKLEFDKEQALEAAMCVFWKKGFVGASLSDLTEGMGINKPSLYATFGNKEALFIQATQHYLDKYSKPKTELLQTDAEAKTLGLSNDAESHALFLVTTINGTAAMARAGKTLSELETVIDHALQGVGLV